jgi:hypothetical protein
MKLFATLNRLICGAAISSLFAWAVPVGAVPIIGVVSPAAVSAGTNFVANLTVTDATDLYAIIRFGRTIVASYRNNISCERIDRQCTRVNYWLGR